MKVALDLLACGQNLCTQNKTHTSRAFSKAMQELALPVSGFHPVFILPQLQLLTLESTFLIRYADDTTLMAESEEELKSLLMKAKEESEKVGLKLNIQETKIRASGPITSWEIDGETVETVSDFIFWGSRITADGDCSHEIKRRLLLGRKVMTNLDSIFKSRHYFAN